MGVPTVGTITTGPRQVAVVVERPFCFDSKAAHAFLVADINSNVE